MTIPTTTRQEVIAMTRILRRSVTVLASALLASVFAVAPANASASTGGATSPATASDVATFTAKLTSDAASGSDAKRLLAQFAGLSDQDKAVFVAVATSDSLFNSPEVTVVPAGSSTTMTRSTAVAGRFTNTLSTALATFTIYDVTSTYTFNNVILGVTIGRFTQTFKYQTGNNVVQTATSCAGGYTGFSGFWSISTTNNKWVSGGQGYCDSDYNLSLVYQGSSISMNKRQSMVVNGQKIVGASLVNL
jgi:hypothetical protein